MSVAPQDGKPPAYTSQPIPPPPGTVGIPQQMQWAPAPGTIAGCPQGLEYLSQIDHVVIKQQVDLIEAFTGWEQANKYQLLNTANQQIYFAAEESGMCMRQLCGPQRGFEIHITDNMNAEVLRLRRDFKCFAGCCWCAKTDCCAHEVTVEAPVGHVIGYVRQEYSGWSPNFSIRDADQNIILRVHGPCCVLGLPCCEDVFQIYSADDTQVLGNIKKKPGLNEIFTDANTFGAQFPMNLDAKAKAAVLGAVFLIDFMYFEGQGGKVGGYH